MVVQKKQLARILSLCEDTVSNAALPSHTTLIEIVSRALAIPIFAISNMFYVLVEWPTLSSK